MTYENSNNPRVIEEDGDEFVVYENLIIIDGEVVGGFYDTYEDAVFSAYRIMMRLEDSDAEYMSQAPNVEAIKEYFRDRDDVAFADIAQRRVVYE